MKPTPTKRSAKARKNLILFKKARPVWAWAAPERLVMCSQPDKDCGRTQLYLCLPAAPEDVERMREAAHAAVCNEFTSPKGPPGLKDYSDSVLRALGLLTPARKTKAL